MTGLEGSVHTADNTQELAELFDATLKFTSVLKKKGVSQSTLTVRTALTQRERATFISSKVAAAKSVLKSPAGSSAMPTTDAQGEELWMPPDNTPSRRQGRSCSSPVKDSLLNSRQTHIDSCHSCSRFAMYWRSSLLYLHFVEEQPQTLHAGCMCPS